MNFKSSCLLISVLLMFLIYADLSGQADKKAQNHSSITELRSNWEYKYLLPRNETAINADSGWLKAESPSQVERIPDCREVWMRTRLPEIAINEPSIFIAYVINKLEVFCGDSKIYSSENFYDSGKNSPNGWRFYIIDLPPGFRGQILTLKVISPNGYAGIKGDISIGSARDFISSIIDKDFIKTLLGIILIAAGFIGLMLFFLINDLKNTLGIITTQISMGVWTLTESGFTQLVLKEYSVIYYTYHIALFGAVTGFFMFFDTLVAPRYKKLSGILWRLLLAYSILMSIADLVFKPEHQTVVVPFFAIICLSIIFLFWAGIGSFRTAGRHTKMLLIAIGIYALFGLIEALWYFHHLMFNSWESIDTKIIHFGGFLFLGFLTWISISRFVNLNKEVIKSKEEALRNEQLAGIAIRNEKKARENYTWNLLEKQEEERKRIAGELHDSLGQELLIIKNRALLGIENESNINSAVTHFNEISSLSSQAIAEVRQIIYNLRPFQLDRIGLTSAIESLINRLKESVKIHFTLYIDNIDNIFEEKFQINIYRIIQEGVNNIIKHSDATEAVLMISKEEDFVYITIEDNGKGFNYEKMLLPRSNMSGFGLTGICERISFMGGKIEVNSLPRKGSVLKIIVPFSNTNKDTEEVL